MKAPFSLHSLIALTISGVVAASAVAHAVEVQVGQVYSGGTWLESSELGVAFTVPPGWRGAWPAGSEVFVLQPESDPSVYILAMGEEATREDLAATMAAPISLGDGLSLSPTGQVTNRGKALVGRYQVVGGAHRLDAYGEAVAGAHGVAVAYILIATPASLASHEAAVRKLTDGTALGAPTDGQATAEGGGTGSGEKDSWDAYLKGKYIVRYYTATGYTDEQHLWLCSDRSFYRRGAGGGFGGGASGAFQADSTGRWMASGIGEYGRLELSYADGGSAQHELRWDYQKNQLFVDGKRWLHGKNEVCS